MQPSDTQAVLYPIGPEPPAEQLRPRNHPVLLRRQRQDLTHGGSMSLGVHRPPKASNLEMRPR
jgi:hypothetical protein